MQEILYLPHRIPADSVPPMKQEPRDGEVPHDSSNKLQLSRRRADPSDMLQRKIKWVGSGSQAGWLAKVGLKPGPAKDSADIFVKTVNTQYC